MGWPTFRWHSSLHFQIVKSSSHPSRLSWKQPQHFFWDATLHSVIFHRTSVLVVKAIRATHLLDFPPLRMSFEIYTLAKITRSSGSGRRAGSQKLTKNTTKITLFCILVSASHYKVTITVQMCVQQQSGSALSVDIVTNYSTLMCRKLQDCILKYVDNICTIATQHLFVQDATLHHILLPLRHYHIRIVDGISNIVILFVGLLENAGQYVKLDNTDFWPT